MKFSNPKLTNLVILAGLFLLAGLKWYYGGCRLWICGAFVGLVVAFMILSDFTDKPKGPSEGEPGQ